MSGGRRTVVADAVDETITVVVRMRPLTGAEVARGQATHAWRVSADGRSIEEGPGGALSSGGAGSGAAPHSYEFDTVFGPNATNGQVYARLGKPVVTAALDGFNGCVFVYGQTSSGKTWTMKGSEIDPEAAGRGSVDKGVIPLAIDQVFETIAASQEREFLLRVSYCEIYNESVNDLLDPSKRNLRVFEDAGKGVVVDGLTEDIVRSADQVLALMSKGERNRSYGATNANEYSSRSHTIFRMVLESRSRSIAASIASEGGDPSTAAVRVSFMYLIDLAGSERVGYTGTTGTRLKEGAYINKSLLTLGTVIHKLSEAQRLGRDRGHIPYRDSKLTRILQPSLGGNSRTAVCCTVTPAPQHAEESHSTLKFAQRAKSIQNSATVTEVSDDKTLLKQYSHELEQLRHELARVGSGAKITELESARSQLEQERAQIKNKLDGTLLEKESLLSALELKHDETRRLEERIRIFSTLILGAGPAPGSPGGAGPGSGGAGGSATAGVAGSGDSDDPENLAALAEQRIQALPQMMASLRSKLDTQTAELESERRRLGELAETAESRCAFLTKRCALLTEEADALRSLLDSAAEEARCNEAEAATLAAAKAAGESREREALAAARAAGETAEVERQRAATLASEVEMLTGKVTRLESDRAGHSARLDKLMESMDSIADVARREAVAAGAKELTDLRASLEAAEARAALLADQVQDSSAQRAASDTKLQAANARIAELEPQVATIDALRAELGEAQSDGVYVHGGEWGCFF
jgi:centromeric protein E